MNDYKITMDTARASSGMIKMLNIGIPTSMIVRELVMNGIEACDRNPEAREYHQVLVMKDELIDTKLTVVNVGGDYITEAVFKDNLASLANTGNFNSENQSTDANKGCGAKIAVLPKMRNGLLYRSKESGDTIGTRAQMCEDDVGLYVLKNEHCKFLGTGTITPVCQEFSILKDSDVGTEVTCMGDSIHDDTFVRLNIACYDTTSTNSSGSSGSGYGILRYLSHRFWTTPTVPVNVRIYGEYSRKDKKQRGYQVRKVHGLQDIMKSDKCKMYGTLDLVYPGNISVKAHWAVKKVAGESGYSSNILGGHGYTAVAWKGESYRELGLHVHTIKKDINNCGILLNWKDVMIVFEIDSSIGLRTNINRTELLLGENKINRDTLHELFRSKCPQELIDWQRDNEPEVDDEKSFNDRIGKYIKSLGFGSSSAENSKQKNQSINPNPKQLISPKKTKNSTPTSNRIYKRMQAAGNLRNYSTPRVIENSDPDGNLIEFHLSDYTIVVNLLCEDFKQREKRIIEQIAGPCLVPSFVSAQLKATIVENCIYNIFTVESSNSKAPEHIKTALWSPSNLSSNWSTADENRILKLINKKNKLQQKAA